MSFKYEVEIDGKEVTLTLRDYGDVPGRVSRRNINNVEAQVWASLEWGLVEPKHWPVDSKNPGTNVLDEVSQREITACYIAWQKASD